MKAFSAIFKQTIRSAMRSKVFIVLFALILISVIGLPLTIKGDNTAAGLVQISLTYSLNVVIALVSASTLWLGCAAMSSEIESYNIHLVLVKPCPRWIVWFGKWSGLVLMHGIILVASMFIIYALTSYRLASAERSKFFSAEDMTKLRQETLVGRREFRPVPVNLSKELEAEYTRRVNTGKINPNEDKTAMLEAIKPEVIQQVMRNIILKPGESRTWVYEGVSSGRGDTPLYLRFRIYTGDISDTDQRVMPIDWGMAVFKDREGKAVASGAQKPIVTYSMGQGNTPFSQPGGTWQEISTVTEKQAAEITAGRQKLPVSTMPIHATQVIDEENGRVELTLYNVADQMLPKASDIPADNAEAQKAYQEAVKKNTAVMQVVDGPVLLAEAASFFNNFLRTMVMALIQLLFLAALGCSVGAIFSTPVAVSVAVAYIVIGLVVPAAVSAPMQN
ncbi:MAG: hypothetical protein J6S21_04470, partial [Victivallales bacterium]|nr:hypothetical protein [Victivallales bacterium]